MTDERMDARLREAGARWRDGEAATSRSTPAPTPAPALTTGVPRVDVVDLTTPRPRHRARWGLLASAAAVVALVATGAGFLLADDNSRDRQPASGSGESASLRGPVWVLTRIVNASGQPQTPAGEVKIHIDARSELVGTDGCNHIGGAVTATSTTIDFGHGLAMTEMACLDDGVMATATAVDRFLSGSAEWRIDGDELTLSKEAGGSLVFKAQAEVKPSDPADLKGQWVLDSIERGVGSSASASGGSNYSDIGVTFDGAGGFRLVHRCYTTVGTIDLTGGANATLRQTGTTNVTPCPSPPDPAEEQARNSTVDDVMKGEVSWLIQGGQLRIAKDSTAVVFVRSSPAPPTIASSARS